MYTNGVERGGVTFEYTLCIFLITIFSLSSFGVFQERSYQSYVDSSVALEELAGGSETSSQPGGVVDEEPIPPMDPLKDEDDSPDSIFESYVGGPPPLSNL